MHHRWITAAILLIAAAYAPSAARAEQDIQQQCLAAYEATQELKLDRKLVEASQRATFCAQQQCPDVVRADCTKWAVELRESTPTIVVTAKGPGGDLSDVRVYVDDQPVAEQLTGVAIEIDPGRHQLRFEHEGATPIEQQVIIAVGVKNRTIEVRFGAASAPAPTPGPGTEDEPGLPVAGLVLGGIGVASVIVFAALASAGSGEIDDLRSSCGQTQSCAEQEVDDAKLKIIAGDVFLGVGVVAIGVAAALVIAHYTAADDDGASALRWGVAPTPAGAVGAMSLRF